MSFHSTLWTTSLRKKIHVSLFIGRCLRTVCNSFQCTNQKIYCSQIYALLCTVSMAPVWYQVIPSISSPRLAWSVYSPCCKGSFGLFRSDDSNTDLERNWKTWPQYKSDLRCLLRCKVSRFQALEEWHRQPFRFLPSRNQDQELLPSQANTRKATVTSCASYQVHCMIMLLDVSQSNHLDIDITLHLNSRTDSLPTRFVKNQTQAVTRLGRAAGHVASHSKARNHTREQVYHGYHACSLFKIMYGKGITSTKTKPCNKKE